MKFKIKHHYTLFILVVMFIGFVLLYMYMRQIDKATRTNHETIHQILNITNELNNRVTSAESVESAPAPEDEPVTLTTNIQMHPLMELFLPPTDDHDPRIIEEIIDDGDGDCEGEGDGDVCTININTVNVDDVVDSDEQSEPSTPPPTTGNLDSCTVVDLKKMLSSRGLSSKGTKADLISRLDEFM
jgi:hypothetical protein